MKVTYEFNIGDDADDQSFLELFQISRDMYVALSDIDDLLREVRKGWKDPSRDELIDKLYVLIQDSKINDLR